MRMIPGWRAAALTPGYYIERLQRSHCLLLTAYCLLPTAYLTLPTVHGTRGMTF
jgi:hypothetical protein